MEPNPTSVSSQSFLFLVVLKEFSQVSDSRWDQIACTPSLLGEWGVPVCNFRVSDTGMGGMGGFEVSLA